MKQQEQCAFCDKNKPVDKMRKYTNLNLGNVFYICPSCYRKNKFLFAKSAIYKLEKD